MLEGSDPAESVDAFMHPRWLYPLAVGDLVPAVVTGTSADAIEVRVGPHALRIDRDGFAWTRREAPADVAEPGDLVDVVLTELPAAAGGVGAATLDQEPEVEGSLLAIDNRTGHILAMVGGYDFQRSRFNRATQAKRQVGSLFKGILYAAAIDQGWTASSIVMDEPVSFEVGPNQPLYEPTNYDNKYEGPITIRRALEDSRNIPAVWLMNAVGPETVVDFARRVGFSSPMPPFLSVALGSAEATLLEVTNAYSVFPNAGRRMLPFLVQRVVDREGNLLEETRPQSRDALREDTAFIIANLMQGVVQRGTGRRAYFALDWPIGGKTGTVDEYTDAWFVGFDPDITARRLGRLRREADAGRPRAGLCCRAADLDRLHGGVRRDPRRPAGVHHAREHRLPLGQAGDGRGRAPLGAELDPGSVHRRHRTGCRAPPLSRAGPVAARPMPSASAGP